MNISILSENKLNCFFVGEIQLRQSALESEDKKKSLFKGFKFPVFKKKVNIKNQEKVIPDVQNGNHSFKTEIKKNVKPATKTKKIFKIFFKVLFIILVILMIIGIGGGVYGYQKYAKPALVAKDALYRIIGNVYSLKDEIQKRDLSNYDKRMEEINNDLSLISTSTDIYKDFENFSYTKPYYENFKVGKEMLPKGQALLEKSNPRIKAILEILIKESPIISETSDCSIFPNQEKIDECNIKKQELINLSKLIEDATTSSDTTTLEILKAQYATTTDNSFPVSISGIVKSLPEISALYNETENDILELINDFNKINPDYFPEKIFGDLSGKISDIQDLTRLYVDEYQIVSPQIKSSLEMMPRLLGTNGPVRYLVVPQNDKEMRASGGLLTAWGIMTVENGDLIGDISTVDMWGLEGFLSYDLGVTPGYHNIYGQLALMEYGCGAWPLRAQDAGIYSDNYISMNMFKDYYNIAREYAPEAYPPYDYILTFNTNFIEDLVKLVEPITMSDGNVLTGENVTKQIFIETSIDPFEGGSVQTENGDRKGYIGQVGKALQGKIKNMTTEDLKLLINVVMDSVISRHVSFYSSEASMQSYFDSMGLTGRTTQGFNGDYFQLNEAQNCALKANFYVKDMVVAQVNIDDAGNVNRTMNVHWSNSKVYDPAEDRILSGSSNFQYRAWIRFYGQPGTYYSNKYVDGMYKTEYFYYPQDYYDDVTQKQVWDDVMWFDHRKYSDGEPDPSAVYAINAMVPEIGKYTEEDGYRLLIEKHPGKSSEHYVAEVTYKGEVKRIEFDLLRDSVVTFKNGELKVENYPSKLDPLKEFVNKVIE